ncbi:MAG: HlyD family secretion protein [Acidisphaera sp.]|nr:HlyD family secretion protein [Acidisphaera sp.]
MASATAPVASAGAPAGTASRVAEAPVLRSRRRPLLRPALMLGGILAVAIGSLLWWLTGGRIVSIDDAYVQAAKLSVSTDVSGIVAEVAVRDHQRVNKGDLLFRLDDRQFRIALDGARANLAQAALSGEAMKRDYQRMLRESDAKQAQVQSDQADYARFANLVKGGGVTRAEYDNARFKLLADQQTAQSLQVQAQVQLARLGGDANAEVTKLPQYLQALAQVDEAQRELDHTVVRAPFAGIVTDVEQLQPGQYLAAATAAFGLVSTEDVWAEGYPKETELTWVQPGDRATVDVDTYPGRHWRGTVESVAPNSGNEFSVLPAQNSSGNWVKVVQRIPLRVHIDRRPGDPELRAGMSVEIDIDTGHSRSLADLF